MKNQGDYVYFALFGDFDPFEVAKTIQLQPDLCSSKHSKNKERKIPKESVLRYALTRSETEIADVYDISEKVIDKLEEHRECLRTAISRFQAEATLQVVLDYPIDESIVVPAVGFSKRVIQFASEMNASIDFDTYRK